MSAKVTKSFTPTYFFTNEVFHFNAVDKIRITFYSLQTLVQMPKTLNFYLDIGCLQCYQAS